MEELYPVICPHCWQQFEISIDLSVPEQTFVYDCEVCCNPLDVTYQVEDGHVAYCEAQSLEQ